MIPTLRANFNAQFTDERYQQYLAFLNAEFKDSIPFRIAETPVFIDSTFKEKLLDAGDYICQFITNTSFQSKTIQAIPKGLNIPNENPFPDCIVIDFAIADGHNGMPEPQLIELQGFPSLFTFELLQTKALESAYKLPSGYTPFLNGYNSKSYLEFLEKIIKGDPAKHTILLEIKPYEQKTRLDLLLTEKWLNVPIVCLSEIYLKENSIYFNSPMT